MPMRAAFRRVTRTRACTHRPCTRRARAARLAFAAVTLAAASGAGAASAHPGVARTHRVAFRQQTVDAAEPTTSSCGSRARGKHERKESRVPDRSADRKTVALPWSGIPLRYRLHLTSGELHRARGQRGASGAGPGDDDARGPTTPRGYVTGRDARRSPSRGSAVGRARHDDRGAAGKHAAPRRPPPRPSARSRRRPPAVPSPAATPTRNLVWEDNFVGDFVAAERAQPAAQHGELEP